MRQPKPKSKWLRCRLCTGTGQLRVGGECPDCDGQGEVERDSPTGRQQQTIKYLPSNRRPLPERDDEG